MNRKLISKAISDMEDALIEESMFPPVAKDGRPSERKENMKGNSVKSRRVIGIILAACQSVCAWVFPSELQSVLQQIICPSIYPLA